ncbi:uncharacterized protein BKCO1_1070001 [Diplodia corticola]|uniref:Uncharacterized protein n=1 Tax=Diplodia corticola TaxID=236234 RepID=A0A1J9RLR0_9PEZI|nr:uncharacterized protein BKCO1_1070001 [Diplodia corticola]OJD28860.1 hypothetical protein BKCO1_1070001 [Diplodia corticola]
MKVKFSRAKYRIGKARAQYMRRRSRPNELLPPHIARQKKSKLASNLKSSASHFVGPILEKEASNQHAPVASALPGIKGDLTDIILSLKAQQIKMGNRFMGVKSRVVSQAAKIRDQTMVLKKLCNRVIYQENKLDDLAQTTSVRKDVLEQLLARSFTDSRPSDQVFPLPPLRTHVQPYDERTHKGYKRVSEWLDNFEARPEMIPHSGRAESLESPSRGSESSSVRSASVSSKSPSVASSTLTSMVSDGPIWRPPTPDPNAVPDPANDIMSLFQQHQQEQHQKNESPRPHDLSGQTHSDSQTQALRAPSPANLQNHTSVQPAPVAQQWTQRQPAVSPPQQSFHPAQVGHLQSQNLYPGASFTSIIAPGPLPPPQQPNQSSSSTQLLLRSANHHHVSDTFPPQAPQEQMASSSHQHFPNPQQYRLPYPRSDLGAYPQPPPPLYAPAHPHHHHQQHRQNRANQTHPSSSSPSSHRTTRGAITYPPPSLAFPDLPDDLAGQLEDNLAGRAEIMQPMQLSPHDYYRYSKYGDDDAFLSSAPGPSSIEPPPPPPDPYPCTYPLLLPSAFDRQVVEEAETGAETGAGAELELEPELDSFIVGAGVGCGFGCGCCCGGDGEMDGGRGERGKGDWLISG